MENPNISPCDTAGEGKAASMTAGGRVWGGVGVSAFVKGLRERMFAEPEFVRIQSIDQLYLQV